MNQGQLPYQHHKSGSEKNRGLLVFAFLLFGGAAALFLYSQEEQSEMQSRAPIDTYKMVDKHLKDQNKEMAKQRLAVEYENLKNAPSLSQTAEQEKFKVKDSGVEFNSDPRLGQHPKRDVHFKSQEEYDPSPDEYIQNKLYEAELLKQQDRAYREAYAKQYIENARRDGWDVKLGDDFKVLSAKRIKKTNSYYVAPPVDGRSDN